MKPLVLVVGPRPGLLKALDKMGVAYGSWARKPSTRGRFVHVAPVAVGEEVARREAEVIAAQGSFTHVIAGTQSAVMPAAIARRVLGARSSPKSTVLRCHDKLHMKRFLQERGIPMTPFLDAQSGVGSDEIVRALGLPVVLKPRMQSGGRGIEYATDVESLEKIQRRGRLLERYVDAPEVSVESFVSGGKILFESVTEYARKGHINVIPAALEADARERVLSLNRRVIEALRIQWGMTHTEMYITDDGPLFGEIALRPPGGYIMDVLRLVWKFDPWQAFASVELDRPFVFGSASAAHGAAVVLHPGEGAVTAVRGLDVVAAHPTVVRVRVKVAAGDRVPPRTGLGVDVGHVILKAGTRAELFDGLAAVDAALHIDVAEQPPRASG